ncbi:unnamed protein product [Urochloa humidicola]
MEATGMDGGREKNVSSSYTISSTSGTVSTGYTSTSSHLSLMSMEAAKHLEELDEEEDAEFVQPVKKPRKETASEKKIKHIKSLAKEFFGAPPAEHGTGGARMSVLRRWFTELGVGWVLHFSDGAPATAGKLAEHTLDASSWIRALTEIKNAFCLMTSPFPGHGAMDDGEEAATEIDEEQFQSVSFTREAMLEMLTSVDILVAPDPGYRVSVHDPVWVSAPYQQFHALVLVHNTLVTTLSQIQLSLDSSSSTKVGKILGGIVTSVLLAKERKVGEVIWTQMEEIRTRILESVDDGQDSSSCIQNPQGSSDIHEATRSLVEYVMFLQDNYFCVSPVVSQAISLGKYVPQVGDLRPLTSMAVQMVSCLQEKLHSKSEKFPDPSLGLLFILNNSFFIGDQLQYTFYFAGCCNAMLAGKVEGYMERYIEVSWAPVLSCLFNRTPLCFGRNSPLPKFKSEFQKTYNAQKLWKVPDPKLRTTLREAIVKKIVPGYTKYVEDDNVTTPKLTPGNMQQMLQELFEG